MEHGAWSPHFLLKYHSKVRQEGRQLLPGLMMLLTSECWAFKCPVCKSDFCILQDAGRTSPLGAMPMGESMQSTLPRGSRAAGSQTWAGAP